MIVFDDFGLPAETTCECFLKGKPAHPRCFSSYCTCAPENHYNAGARSRGGAEAAYTHARCQTHTIPSMASHIANPRTAADNMYRTASGAARQPKAAFLQAQVGTGYGHIKVPSHIVVNGQKVPMPAPTDALVTKLRRMGFNYGSPQMVERYIAHKEEDAPDDAKR